MDHLNNHVFAAVDIETTGFDPQKDEIVEIAIVVLNNDFSPSNKIFNPIIRPKDLDRIDFDAARKVPLLGSYYREKLALKKDKAIFTRGLDPDCVPDLFSEWANNLMLPPNKKLIPIGCNYAFDRGFLLNFLGPLTYYEVFLDLYRDVLTIANFLNDRAAWKHYPVPFSKVNLQYLCSTLKIDRVGDAHTAISDALVTAKIYKALMNH